MQAIREGADAVVAVGGDGTLHEVRPAFHLIRLTNTENQLTKYAIFVGQWLSLINRGFK